jgi:hypothetical protein
MAVSIVRGPDGRQHEVQHPKGIAPSQIVKYAQQQIASASNAEDAFVVDVGKGLFAGGSQAAVSSAAGVTQWMGQSFGSDSLLQAAEDMRQYGQGIAEDIGLDEDFRQSFFGQVVQGLGQVPVTIGAGAAGLALAGPAGMIGAAAITTGGQMSSEFLTDMEGTLGKGYTEFNPEEKANALTGMLAQTALGTALETVAVGKALKPLLRKLETTGVSGKVLKKAIGEDRNALRELVEAAGAEGLTEAAQGQSLDTLASMLYDEERELITMDTLKRRAMEFGVGAVVGGTVSGGAQILGNPEKVSTTKKDLKKPVSERAGLEVPRTAEVQYKELDGQVRIVPIALGKDEDPITAAEEALRGRYDEKYGITITEVTSPQPLDVVIGEPEVEPDVTTEEVPVQPEAAIEPAVEPVVEPAPEAIEDDAFPVLPEQSARTQLEFDPFADPEPEQAPVEAPVKRSFSLPQNLKKGKPGYRQTQGITFASDLERAVYSATTSTRSEPGKRKRESYRKILQDAGYSTTEINEMGREVRSQMRDQYDGPGSELSVALPQDVVADASATYIPKRFVGEQAEQAPPFFQSFSPEQYDEGRFVDLETKKDLSDQTFEGGSIRIEGGRPVLETSDNASETILGSKASEEGPLVRSNLFKQKAGWKWTKAPEGAPSTIVSVEQGPKHYYTLDFSSSKPLTLKTYPDKKSEPRGRPTTRGKVKLGNPVGEISIRGKLHPVYDTVTVGEPDVVAEAAPVPGPVSTEAAIGRIELEKLAPQANEDFFQFWARVLDSTGTRFKASSKNYGRVAKNAVFDTLKFFKENPKFATYYETDTKLTRQYVESVVGPITDSEFNLFRILAGLTSPSTKLPDNIIDTLRVFKLYKDQGNFNFIVPSKTEKGARTYDKVKTGFLFRSTTGATKATSILAIQKKIDEVGLDATVKYLLEPVTMKELVASKRSLGYKDVGKKSEVKQVVKQATGQDTLIPRMFMFGPKVGAYAMNTLGNVEYTTTDIWESRFIRSYFSGMLESGTGLPENVDEQKIFQEFSSAFNKEFQKQTGEKLEPASLQAVRWFYILNAFNRIGYQYAKTDDTISGYTAKAAQELYGIDPTSGGQSTGADTSPVPAGNRLFGQPLQDSTSVSERYQRSKGIRGQEPRPVVELDEERAAVIGKAYDKMKHDPTNPEVVRAYDALVKETIDQYDAILEDGYAMELSEVEYNSSQDMIDDVRNRKVMRVFSTEDGFGTKGISAKERRENPMLAETNRTDKNGKPLLVNDIFRFVHDFFGHGKLGNGFGPIGEENAWNVHSLMFSPLARRALTTETRGQNSWVNFSGVNDKAFEIRDQARKARADGNIKEAKRLSKLAYSKMKFADQKIGLLPSEFSESTYQEEVTAEAAQPEVEDRGPQDTFANGGQVMDFVESTFDAVAKKVGVAIRPAMGVGYTARYNATQQVIEYNPMALLNRSKSGVKAAMREEIIHASMHKVLMQKATKGGKKVDPGKVWVNFFEAFAKTLTAQERVDIGDVYQSLTTYHALGAEYSRAVVQNLLYGEFSEQYVMQSKGGPAWNRIVDLLRSVQAYMAKVLGPMRKTNPEAAQVIVDSVELLKAADPDARPKNQQVVAEAYDTVDNNTAKENTEAGESVDKKASERIREERKWWSESSFRKTASKYLTPIITRLNRVNPMFGRLLQNLDTAIRERSFGYRKQTEAFFNKLNAVKGAEFQELKQMLFFSPTPEEANIPSNKAKLQRRDALLHKHGLLNMYRLDVQPILEEIYAEYTELGMPRIGYLEDYFPRVVKDLEGLIKSYGHKTQRTFEMLVREENLKRAENKDADGNADPLPEMADSERARFFQDFLQNKFRVDINGARLPGNIKVREINFIDDDKLKYYDDPGVAFGKYTTNMSRAIESFKVVGDTRKGRLQGTLGLLTEKLFSEGQIDQADADEVKTLTELITAQFATENEILKSLGTLTYMATLINPGPVLVQIMDLYKVALYRGLGGVLSGTYRTITGNRRFDIEKDFSIAKTQLSAEFEDPSVLQKALDFGLSRLVPFRQMDTAMKHASIEAAYDDFVKKAKAPVGSKKYEQLLRELTITMGREDALKTISDLKLDKAMDSALVKEALLSELLQRQPLTYLQVPEGYQTDPSKRLFYKLSTFMLLDLNYNRQEFMNDLGGPGKTLKQRTVALRRLAYMATLLTMFGLPSDMLDDWISGKDTYIPEHVMNNMLGMFGLSKYTTTRALEKGTVESVIQRFTPPAINIMIKGESSLRSWVKGDTELFEMKAWQNAPLSDVWYYRTGAGKESQRKYRKKQRKEGITPTIPRS